ncbi:ATP-dependent helicase [Anaerotalea alkaliphila]|uniref:DNA 3'-5' helicase n=1 Tax=Anaerotalea alkaliphila TaxID=2662126 RepID=A0A7X5HTZ7_9FIRM|nr:ATP-dependent helicase [Anaerotalea alkaliphila]NDL66520.1 ATP-dependent helicase [Anaerotalea alkaliphila]
MEMDFFQELEQEKGIRLTSQQKAAVLHGEGHSLLLACPGSGKTTVMVVKTAYMIRERGIPPQNILTLTFSVAAAGDMRKRYGALFGGAEGPMPRFSTIHSFCYGIMMQECRRTGVLRQNIEGKNSFGYTKMQILTNIFEEVNKEKPTEDMVETLAGEISYIKNLLIPPERYKEHDFATANIQKIYMIYAAFKEKHQLYDFDDMLLLAYQLLKRDKGLLERQQRLHPYLQVDEAQDNSRVQNQIIRLLAGGPGNSLFMVADDDQTIYEWRGADPGAVLEFDKTYPSATLYRMEENFRSSREIVDLAGRFIEKNQKRHPKRIITKNPPVKPVGIHKVYNEVAQMKFVLEDLAGQKGPLEEKAVLYRNNLTAVLFAEALERQGIPFTIRGNKGHFFKHWVLEDIRNFLRFSLDFRDLSSFDGIYYKNGMFLSKAGYGKAKSHVDRKRDLFDALLLHGGLQEFQKNRLYGFRHDFRSLKEKPLDLAIVTIEEDLGYGKWAESGAKGRGMTREGVANILATLKFIGKRCRGIQEFLDRLDLLEAAMARAGVRDRAEGVVLSTVHSSKGLEFDHVYMVDLFNSVFPGAEALKAAAEGDSGRLEAERRLFYVAKTRARTDLHLLQVKNYNGKPVEPSLFLTEVEEVLSQGKRTAKKAKG